MQLDKTVLLEIVKREMPYGKYKGRLLCDLPIHYLEWMDRKKAFPQGRLGELIQNVLLIKANDLDHILRELKTW